jgi:pilus assembly protein CpaB
MPKAIRIAALSLLALAVLLVIIAINLGRGSPEKTGAISAGAPADASQRIKVITAARTLPAGSVIAAADLTTAEVNAGVSGVFLHPSELAGAVPVRDIGAGQTITQSLLIQSIATQLLPGERAVAVPVDELMGVGNRVSPGDYVDVFMSLRDLNTGAMGARSENTQTRLLLSRLRVLGYGNRDLSSSTPDNTETSPSTVAPEPGSRADSISARGNEQPTDNAVADANARSAVLAVPVEDAGRLLLGAHNGKLFLALRNPGDNATADTSVFHQPAPVLAMRNDLDPATREATQTPENQAYAGIDLEALAGNDPRARSAPVALRSTSSTRASAPRRASGVEIIRGAQPATPLSSP